jgi:DNA mismatch endonuclease (patch repair protein)
MSAIRSKGMKPEMVVRSLAHTLGCRYRLHVTNLPGKPDLVFPVRRKIIFVHGCFWHAHGCTLTHVPKSNLDYWLPKLERNRARDAKSMASLKAEGWKVLVLWECQTERQADLRKTIRNFLG